MMRHSRRSLLKGFAGLMALGFSATACGGSREIVRRDGRIVVEFWHAMGSGQGRAVNEIADRFNKSQSVYTIRPVYQGNYNALSQKLIASLYARRNPVLSQMYPGWTTRFYRFGYLRTVDELIRNDASFAPVAADIYPTMVAENTLKNPRSGVPELVTLPFNKSVYVVQANWTRMEKLGFSKPPATRDELMALTEAMTVIPEGSDTPTVHGFATRGMIEDLTVMTMAADSQLLNEETGEILLNSPPVVESLRYMAKLINGEKGHKTGYVESRYLSDVLGSERVGMYIASTASFPFNDRAVGNKFIWRAFAVPPPTGVTARTLMQGTNVGMFNNLTDEESAGGWEFMKYLCSPAINSYWAVQTGYMPIRRATKDDADFQKMVASNISYANSIATLETATYEPRVMYWESIRQVLNRRVQAVMLGREEPEKALAETTVEVEAIQRAST